MTVPITFVSACAASDDLLMIATIPDEIRGDNLFTRIYYLSLNSDDAWHYSDWADQQVVSVCLRRAKDDLPRAGCAMTGEGQIEIANSSRADYESISGAGLEGNRGLGELTKIREIGSTLFACGAYGQVYRRIATGWTAIDEPLVAAGRSILNAVTEVGSQSIEQIRKLTQNLSKVPNFNDIAGSSEDDVYVCGNGGNFFHYDGNNWANIDTETDLILTCMHCVSADEIWVAGQDGIILQGNFNSGFRNMGQYFPESYIWSIRKFRGEIFLGTVHGLYIFTGNGVRLVETPYLKGVSPIISIDSFSENGLWIVTNRHVFYNDGDQIRFYPHGDNPL
ncbi:hypothetical protein GOZ89_25345 [Agrobacterium vitis]|uniref:hypothetical protein n=1 Tax=Agrobacterium vitis TaxID=373 RepID=UPI0012E964BE|nr:hypothetical protein [Agrobacterium vitis]MVA82724.1 hypothetical protein [Agrobacterium vitis]